MPLSHAHDDRRIHSMGCSCRRCRHPELPDGELDLHAGIRAANRFALNTFIGLGLGMGAAALLDWYVSGPGVLSIFGIGL
ncbi:MAG TPA: hypothetical protein VF503_01225 [Sphingobium sp.]|uniref:hypothetical protein n=1 Tax=Sphingobium sp. TaxID=1912891 RepID=UPI002ECFBCC1